jgi:hypothetical protein
MIRAALPALLLMAATTAEAEPLRPAELPPADYAGLQYVDSKGCMFARAGNGTEVLWIPRVSRQGVPVCGNPPSGQRVPVVEEIGVQPVPIPSPTTAPAAEAKGGYFVAVGSYRQEDNADRAEARLAELNYATVRGRVQGAGSTVVTVFAGPFEDAETAASARTALKKAGFPEATLIGP